MRLRMAWTAFDRFGMRRSKLEGRIHRLGMELALPWAMRAPALTKR